MSESETIKEQLASLCTDVKWLKEQFSNHLRAHWTVTCILLSAVIVEAVAMVAGVIKLIK